MSDAKLIRRELVGNEESTIVVMQGLQLRHESQLGATCAAHLKLDKETKIIVC